MDISPLFPLLLKFVASTRTFFLGRKKESINNTGISRVFAPVSSARCCPYFWVTMYYHIRLFGAPPPAAVRRWSGHSVKQLFLSAMLLTLKTSLANMPAFACRRTAFYIYTVRSFYSWKRGENVNYLVFHVRRQFGTKKLKRKGGGCEAARLRG